MSATPVDAADVGRAPLGERLRPHLTGWLFALPFLVIFLVFLAIPILASFVLSFTGFGIANLRDWFGAEFVGFDNYTKLFDDERFLKAARNTAVFVVVGVPLTIALGLLAAVGLNQAIGRIQVVLPRRLLPPGRDEHRRDRRHLALPAQPRLRARSTRALAAARDRRAELARRKPRPRSARSSPSGVWRNLGFDMVIFLAALQGINPALYEAARVDGARPHQIFFRITLPLLRPTILFLAVITSAGYLQLFEEPFVMTGGGPLDSTLSVAMYVYEQGFHFLNLGYASAVAYALFVAIVVLAFIQFRAARDRRTCDARSTRHRQRDAARSRPPADAPARRLGAQVAGSSLALLLGLVVMVGPFLWMVLGSLKSQRELLQAPPTWLPAEPDDGQLRAGSSTGSTSRTYFWNSTLIAVAITAGEHRLLLDDRLRAREAPVRRARPALRARARHAARAGQRHARAAVRADEQARAREHALGGDPARRGGAARRVPDAPVHALDPGRPARGGAGRRRARVLRSSGAS